MRRPPVRAAIALLIVAGLLAIALVPALGGTRAPVVRHSGVHTEAGTDTLQVTVSDTFVFATSINEVQPGDAVEVVVTQLGTVPHTFTLSATADYTFPSTDGASDLVAYFAAHPPLVNVVVGTTTGAKFFSNFTAPPVGVYEYVCEQPGHFPSMSGLLGSGKSPGVLSTNNGPGAPVFIISGIIVALVIIALVLGFVVGKRRGAAEEMAPERLGYREPPAEPPHAP